MKIIFDNGHLTIFLNNLYLKDINLNKKEVIEKFLNELTNKLKFYYDITLKGFINVWLYLDKNYGLVIKIEKEELEYFDYNEALDMNIKIKEVSFLYELKEVLNKPFLNKFIIYKYRDNFYLKPKQKLSDIDMGILLENTKIIYKNVDRILKSEVIGRW